MGQLMTNSRGVLDSLESMTLELILTSPIVQPHPQELTEDQISDMPTKVLHLRKLHLIHNLQLGIGLHSKKMTTQYLLVLKDNP